MKKTPLYQRDFVNRKSLDKVLERIREHYQLRTQPKSVLLRRYFDTFDWRLYRSGQILEIDTAGITLCRVRTLGKQGEQVTSVQDQEPEFNWNFTQAEMRDFMARITGARRLLLLSEIRVNLEPFVLLDRSGKVLVRCQVEKYLRPDRIGRNRTVLLNCRFIPLRGYGKICTHLLNLIDTEATAPMVKDDPFLYILSLDKRRPSDYTSKLNLTFEPELSIGQALAKTLLFHMNVILKNIPGIKSDLDTEFLHDFRIANRRSRTLVTQVKNVMPPAQEKYYRDIFSWLSNETSAHRDLDVFLLDIPHYASLLPAKMREDLEPLRMELEHNRRKVHARLLKVMDSDRFRTFAANSRAYLSKGLRNHFQTATGIQPVTKIANLAIWRVYQKLLKQGVVASSTGDREVLHELRKTGKKLRYLLETFKSLYPDQDIEQVLLHCRKLQNLLGQIVDYRVQQSYLLGLSGSDATESVLPHATQACIRHLVDTYHTLEENECEKFEGRFARFSNTRTQKQFRNLFKETG